MKEGKRAVTGLIDDPQALLDRTSDTTATPTFQDRGESAS